jgi:hypothetical protein
LPNLQDLQALLAIILAIAQGVRRVLGLGPQILRQVRERARRRPAVVLAGTQAREARRREPGTFARRSFSDSRPCRTST